MKVNSIKVKWLWLIILACLAANLIALELIANSDNTLKSSYQMVRLDDKYGKLLTISKKKDYYPNDLYHFLLNKVCDGVYIANCSYNLNNLNINLGINLKSDSSSLILSSLESISAYKVIYTTPGLDLNSRRVSGALLVPNLNHPIKGVILFYHYTVLDKNNIPSNFIGDEFQLSRLIAATLVSDGYIVALPDYIGFGVDQNEVHPYILYPQVNAVSGIYMLNALKPLLSGYSYKSSDSKIPLFISGYSEGGSYALWASRIIQKNYGNSLLSKFSLIKTVPISGAYNLSQVTMPYEFANVTDNESSPYNVANWRVAAFIKPGLIANALSSYAYYSNSHSESNVLSTDFFYCDGCVVDGFHYNISNLLAKPARDSFKYQLLFSAAHKTGYSYTNNSVLPLIESKLLEDKSFNLAVARADIFDWQSFYPISFLVFEHDSVVPELNSETAYESMVARGSKFVKITRIPNQDFKVRGYLPWTDVNVDHPQGLSFMLLFARKEFDDEYN